MSTGARVFEVARQILQDDGTRYPSAQLLGFLNEGIEQVWTVRPDIFVGRYTAGVPVVLEAALADPLPVPRTLTQALGEYVAGRAELRDDEFAVDGRAMTMREQLKIRLLQGV